MGCNFSKESPKATKEQIPYTGSKPNDRRGNKPISRSPPGPSAGSNSTQRHYSNNFTSANIKITTPTNKSSHNKPTQTTDSLIELSKETYHTTTFQAPSPPLKSPTTSHKSERSSGGNHAARPSSAYVRIPEEDHTHATNSGRPQTSISSRANRSRPDEESTIETKEAWGENDAGKTYGTVKRDFNSLDNSTLEDRDNEETDIGKLNRKLKKQKRKNKFAEEQQAEQIANLERQIAQKNKEIHKLNDRLSVEMSNKVSSDESALENINVKARPMLLADEFRNICSNEWLDANEVLEKIEHVMRDDERYQILCNVIYKTKETCDEVRRMIMSMFDQATANPLLVFKECFDKRDKKKAPRLCHFKYPSINDTLALPESMQKTTMNQFRLHVESMEFKYIIKFVDKAIEKRYSYWRKHNHLQEYTAALTKFCWKMILQRPPMTFDEAHKGEMWSDKTHPKLEPYFGSDLKTAGCRIKYYVFPTLMHGDMIMVPGKVMVNN